MVVCSERVPATGASAGDSMHATEDSVQQKNTVLSAKPYKESEMKEIKEDVLAERPCISARVHRPRVRMRSATARIAAHTLATGVPGGKAWSTSAVLSRCGLPRDSAACIIMPIQPHITAVDQA